MYSLRVLGFCKNKSGEEVKLIEARDFRGSRGPTGSCGEDKQAETKVIQLGVG